MHLGALQVRAVQAIAWSPSSASLAVSLGGRLQILDAETWRAESEVDVTSGDGLITTIAWMP